jgi:hypothetical protein
MTHQPPALPGRSVASEERVSGAEEGNAHEAPLHAP